MGPQPTHGDENQRHPEQSEGSAVPVWGELMQILRFAQYDNHTAGLREFQGSILTAQSRISIFEFRVSIYKLPCIFAKPERTISRR